MPCVHRLRSGLFRHLVRDGLGHCMEFKQPDDADAGSGVRAEAQSDPSSNPIFSRRLRQNVVALKRPGAFAYVGVTDNLAGAQGVLLTSDGGKSWSPRAWPESLSNSTVARYGAFVSDQVMYVTGGTWKGHSGSRDASIACFEWTEVRCAPVAFLLHLQLLLN